jgi:hypothetical protein
MRRQGLIRINLRPNAIVSADGRSPRVGAVVIQRYSDNATKWTR